jgi:hypothetical protein
VAVEHKVIAFRIRTHQSRLHRPQRISSTLPSTCSTTAGSAGRTSTGSNSGKAIQNTSQRKDPSMSPLT